jgi:hypothetical protein
MLNPFDPTPVSAAQAPGEDASSESTAEAVAEPAAAEARTGGATTDAVDAAEPGVPAESAEPSDDSADDEVYEADEVLMAATDQAKAALELITPADTIGEYLGYIVEGEHVLSLLFDCLMTGYPGWRWTVSLSRVDGNSAPQVLETELMPGDDALLAPEWVPWSDRLADSKVAEELAAAALAGDIESDDDDDDDSDDDDDDDSDDDDDDDSDGDDDDSDDESAESDDAADDGVDVLDGIDFDDALTASELHESEADQAEAEADDRAPQPPAQARGMQFSAEDDRQHQGD